MAHNILTLSMDKIRLHYYTGGIFFHFYMTWIFTPLLFSLGMWFYMDLVSFILSGVPGYRILLLEFLSCAILCAITYAIRYTIYRLKITSKNYLEITPETIIYSSHTKRLIINVDEISDIVFNTNNTITFTNKKKRNKQNIPFPDICNYCDENCSDITSSPKKQNKRDINTQSWIVLNIINNICGTKFCFRSPKTILPRTFTFSMILGILTFIPHLILFEPFEESNYQRQISQNDNYEVIYQDSTRGSINGYKFVDLGLSVMWATSNLGAEEPCDSGKYYFWGNIYDITHPQGAKENKEIKNKRKNFFSNFERIYGDSRWDAATAHMGYPWRMPQEYELDELKNKCNWELTYVNSQYCYKVTGPNGNHILLPLCGLYISTTNKKSTPEPYKKILENRYARYLNGTYVRERFHTGVYCLDIINKELYTKTPWDIYRCRFSNVNDFCISPIQPDPNLFVASIRAVADINIGK